MPISSNLTPTNITTQACGLDGAEIYIQIGHIFQTLLKDGQYFFFHGNE